MSYTIISTYPAQGSQNVGDKLIEERTKALIADVTGEDDFLTIWREDDILSRVDEINTTKGVVFACLAIRPNMVPDVYNLPLDLSSLTVPLIPVASGTSFMPFEINQDRTLSSMRFDERTLSFLKEVDRLSPAGISCRGDITYNSVRQNGITGAVMTGDVAFYDPRFDDLQFERRPPARRIVISTPHYPNLYAEHFYRLIDGVKAAFPEAEVSILLHGTSEWIDQSRTERVEMLDAYGGQDPASLDIYSRFDLHIGYRVHGHVSALKRRIPSYLFAIDGRGYDYGETLRLGTTIQAWRPASPKLNRRTIEDTARIALRKKRGINFNIEANLSSIDYMVDLVRRDQAEGFERFLGFETEIARFNRSLIAFVQRAACSRN